MTARWPDPDAGLPEVALHVLMTGALAKAKAAVWLLDECYGGDLSESIARHFIPAPRAKEAADRREWLISMALEGLKDALAEAERTYLNLTQRRSDCPKAVA